MGLFGRLLKAATPDNPRFSLNDPGAWEAFNAGSPSSAGVNVNRASALTLSSYWRGVHLLSATIAKLPLQVMKKQGRHKIVDNEHPAYALEMYQPDPSDPICTAYYFKRVKMGHVLLTGNGYSYLYRNGAGQVVRNALLDPNHITPVIADGALWYIYKTPAQVEGRKIPAEDISHWKGLGFDGLIGYDILTYARDVMGLGLGTQRYAGTFFGNGARPGAVIKVPGKLTDQAKRNLLSGWDRMHKGLDNAHKAGILDGGADVMQFNVNPEDSQLIEQRKFSIIDIANFLGIQPHKLGAEGVNAFASRESADQAFLDDDLDPWLIMIEQEERMKMLSEAEKDDESHVIEFDRMGLVRADLTARANYYRAALGGHPWITPNEARAMENMNPDDAEESDRIPEPLNMGKTGGINNAPKDPGGNQPGNPTENNAEVQTPAPTAAIEQSIRAALSDAAARIIRRVAVHARRAAKEPKKYLAWVAAFEQEHLPTCRLIAQPALQIFLSYRNVAHTLDLAAECLYAMQRALDQAADVSAAQLEAAVDAQCNKLLSEFPDQLANHFFQQAD